MCFPISRVFTVHSKYFWSVDNVCKNQSLDYGMCTSSCRYPKYSLSSRVPSVYPKFECILNFRCRLCSPCSWVSQFLDFNVLSSSQSRQDESQIQNSSIPVTDMSSNHKGWLAVLDTTQLTGLSIFQYLHFNYIQLRDYCELRSLHRFNWCETVYQIGSKYLIYCCNTE